MRWPASRSARDSIARVTITTRRHLNSGMAPTAGFASFAAPWTRWRLRPSRCTCRRRPEPTPSGSNPRGRIRARARRSIAPEHRRYLAKAYSARPRAASLTPKLHAPPPPRAGGAPAPPSPTFRCSKSAITSTRLALMKSPTTEKADASRALKEPLPASAKINANGPKPNGESQASIAGPESTWHNQIMRNSHMTRIVVTGANSRASDVGLMRVLGGLGLRGAECWGLGWLGGRR